MVQETPNPERILQSQIKKLLTHPLTQLGMSERFISNTAQMSITARRGSRGLCGTVRDGSWIPHPLSTGVFTRLFVRLDRKRNGFIERCCVPSRMRMSKPV
jgi:hypothetical protein